MRRRRTAIILFPIVILLWLIGWSFFWLGVRNNDRVSRTTDGKEMVEIAVETCEEQNVRPNQR